MFEFFGFDPKTLSDEELLNRMGELAHKIMVAHRMGNAPLIDQIRAQQYAIQMEQRERAFQTGIGSRLVSAPTVVFETDPDLAAKHKADREAEAAKQAAPARQRPKTMAISRRERIRPTSQPTKDDE